MRIAGLIQDSIVDGPGLRFVVFAQGCALGCEGCHNPQAQDPSGGTETDAGEIIGEMLRNPLTDGLTLTGGEPFLQAGECAKLAAAAREKGLNVWAFSGYTFEALLGMAAEDPAVTQLLRLTDVLVDGQYIAAERSLSLKWRGSRNQRLVDVPKSLEAGEAVILYAACGIQGTTAESARREGRNDGQGNNQSSIGGQQGFTVTLS